MSSMVIQIVLSFMCRIRIKLLLIIVGCGVAFGTMSFLKGLGYPTPDSSKAFCLFGLQLLLGLTWLITYYSAEFSSKMGFPTGKDVDPGFSPDVIGDTNRDTHILCRSGDGLDTTWNKVAAPRPLVLLGRFPGMEHGDCVVFSGAVRRKGCAVDSDLGHAPGVARKAIWDRQHAHGPGQDQDVDKCHAR